MTPRFIFLFAALFAVACSPESMLTPESCRVKSVRRVHTLTIRFDGDTTQAPVADRYIVTMEDGIRFDLSEAEAIEAQQNPERACKEAMGE